MAEQVVNYKCPACTGPLQYSPEKGKMICEYCDSEFELAEIEKLYEKKETAAESEWDTSGLNDDWGTDAEGMKSYSCPSCGAELVCDASTAASNCPYCGNNTIVPGQFTGMMKPDFVIPFKLNKKDALEALNKHYGKRYFLPKEFKKKNHIEKVQGVYVPFWLFDGEAEGRAMYEATRTKRRKRRGEEVVDTSYYDVERGGSIKFEKVPVDASTKMPDDYMDSIEPYDYSELKAFSNVYLPGFLADKYDVSVEESMSRADERCANTFEAELRKTVDTYESVINVGKDVHLKRGKVHYALMPVWLLNTKWKGKDYLFAMNGQTGKLVGDLPMDKGKYRRLFFAIAMGLSIISSSIIWALR